MGTVDEESLITLCVAQANDDWPKLMFADWLEDQGRTREAWRLRKFLQVYRGQWLAATQLPTHWYRWWPFVDPQALELRRTIHSAVASRYDELWRLVVVILDEVLRQHYPLQLRSIARFTGWGEAEIEQLLREMRCRIVLASCGIDVGLTQVGARANALAQRAESQWVQQKHTLRQRVENPWLQKKFDHLWHLSRAADAVAWAATQTNATSAGRETHHPAGAATMSLLEPLLVCSELARARAFTLWTCIRDTNPAW